MRALGDTTTWGGFWDSSGAYVSPREVYLWRATLDGADISTPEKALLIVQAIGGLIDTFDIKGITVKDNSVDVVLMSSDVAFPKPWKGGWDSAEDITEYVTKDKDVRATFPALSVSGAQLLQLVAPENSLDFWRARAVVWKNGLGPVQEFVERHGVYKGIADDGKNLVTWENKPGLVDPVPVKPSPTPSAGSASRGWLLAGLVVVIAVVGSALLPDSKKRS